MSVGDVEDGIRCKTKEDSIHANGIHAKRFVLLSWAINEARYDANRMSSSVTKEKTISTVEFYFNKYIELLGKE